MEHVLPVGQEYCIECSSQRWLKVSRFGCVFCCHCPNRFIDFHSALRKYVTAVALGERNVGFLPVISWRTLTGNPKIAQVELDLMDGCVCLRIMNTTSEDALRIVSDLPLSLQTWKMREDGRFRFSMEALDVLLHELRLLSGDSGDNLYLNEPSKRCLEVALAPKPMVSKFHLSDLLPPKLFSALHQHQIDGICKALSFNGRALFADEMGVGKTIQAIGTLAALRAFPALIVCPAALRHMWSEEVEKWLMDLIDLDDIHVINSSSNFISPRDAPKVVITSYHMASILAYQIRARSWSCIIADESHILHTTMDASTDARYTSLVCDLGRQTRYCLFLSGTPSLTSPFDLFNQVDTLSCGLLGQNRCEFALRYCRTDVSPYFRVFEPTRDVELYSLLLNVCMIRRLKSDTLIDLPSKQRILLRVPEVGEGPVFRRGISFQEEYSASWTKKREKILEVVDFLLEKHQKIVLFAHHIKLLDCLTAHIGKKKEVTWMRIDGSTPATSRRDLLLRFNNGDARVSIIGITACAVGIHLTGAACALFAELPPDVAWMQQAEDRLHRPGQEKYVTLYYIIGAGSFFDGEFFARLCRSFQIVRQTTDGSSCSLTAGFENHPTLGDGAAHTKPVTSSCPGSLFRLSDSAPLRFRISCNTSRIHVVQEGRYLTSLSAVEAQHYWILHDEFSRQLKEFLLNVELLPLVEFRKLKFSGVWLPSNFTWKIKGVQRKTSVRYAQRNLLIGRVFFWMVNRCNLPPHSYGALLVTSRRSCYTPLCLECNQVFSGPTSLSPGDVVHIQNDTEMFCSGACRELFYLKRSGSAARRCVREADKGVCSCCQVDCESLCLQVAVATTWKDRAAIIDRIHPQMRHYPRLFNRIIENPVSGNVWNADHILPVSQGGGEANMDNLQTLCVACHAEKTRSEAQMGYRYAPEKHPRTTVDVSSRHFALKFARRVTVTRMLGWEKRAL